MPQVETDATVDDSAVGTSAGSGSIAGQRERQRVTKACDHCNQTRSKCEGVSPCSRCVAYHVPCTFDRKSRRNGRKKRRATPPLLGRHPWPRPQAATVASASDPTPGMVGGVGGAATNETTQERGSGEEQSGSQMNQQVNAESIQGTLATEMVNDRPLFNTNVPPTPADPGGYETFHGSEQQHLFGHFDVSAVNSLPPYLNEYMDPAWQGFSSDSQLPYLDRSLFGSQTPGNWKSCLTPGLSRIEVGNGSGLRPRTPFSEASGTSSSQQRLDIEYPVLAPLIPFCSHQIAPALACKLLEGYFSTFSEHDAYASSPFLISHVLRKQSVLSPMSFRDCKPALLSSMLLVAAQTVEMPFFGSAPTARNRLCQVLFELTVTLLSTNPPSSRSSKASTLGENAATAQERHLVGSLQSVSMLAATRTIDDVIAYMHLAVISSAAENKSVGSHWWQIAVQLAKELKLNLELPPSRSFSGAKGAAGFANPPHRAEKRSPGFLVQPPAQEPQMPQVVPAPAAGASDSSPIGMVDDTVTEEDGTAHIRAGLEDQEERRRVWWSLYVLDRHFAVIYNSPPALRDTDCQDLAWPLDDASWQAGAYWPSACSPVHGEFGGSIPGAAPSHAERPRGPSAKCSGAGIFDLMIPFAFILGQIIDMRQMMSQPHFKNPQAKEIGQILTQQIQGQLETFRGTLDRLPTIPARNGELESSGFGGPPNMDLMSPTRLRYQRLMVTYGHYFYHILSVLLHGEWDLLTALSDQVGGGERSPSSATPGNDTMVLSCATQAAEALQNVVSQDHELKFNPFLMGIFLVLSSYPLLVAASKDMQRANTQVLKACKVTVRAHEASVATLHAEYQRKNRKLLLSAIEGIQYGPSAITREMSALNERIIQLFRWSPGGRGLGL